MKLVSATICDLINPGGTFCSWVHIILWPLSIALRKKKLRLEIFDFCMLIHGLKRCCCSVTKSCLTRCDPMDYIAHQAPLSSTIFQSLTPLNKFHYFYFLFSFLPPSLFSLPFSLCWEFSSVQSLSCVWLFVTPWTAAHQASPCITNSWFY